MANSSTLSVLTGEQVGPLITEPLTRESVALAVSTVVNTDQAAYRIPRITDDPSADWLDANTEIQASEATGADLTVNPAKVAGISYIANELANDSDPQAAGIIGQRLAVDIARRIDRAFFGTVITDDQDADYNAVRPVGLESIAGASLNNIDAVPTAGLDAYIDALAAAESEGVELTSWVLNPTDAATLAKVKTGTGSNVLLLGGGAENGPSRTILGIPVRTSPSVTSGTAWGIPAARTFVVLRRDTEVVIDRSARFEYDQTAIRAVCRIGFGFPHARGIIRIKDVA
ncbi:phage major capsid protein [Microbacterium sp. MAHUQ-60]|uniref:phage major capsid protein n=1 Tax=unclassified Microbacterium TaxID=2609290 RepID=UPI003617EB2E